MGRPGRGGRRRRRRRPHRRRVDPHTRKIPRGIHVHVRVAVRSPRRRPRRARAGREARGRNLRASARCGHHHRHLPPRGVTRRFEDHPRRTHAHVRDRVAGRDGGEGVRRARGSDVRVGFPDGATEDGHAAAARRRDDRVGRARGTTGRRTAATVRVRRGESSGFVGRRGGVDVLGVVAARVAGVLLRHQNHGGDGGALREIVVVVGGVVVASSGRVGGASRASVLSEPRDEVSSVSQPHAPRLARARGPGHGRRVSQRPLQQPGTRRPGGDASHHPRFGTREDAPAGVRRGVRLRRPPRTSTDTGDASGRGSFPRGPDQRHHRVRGSRGAGFTRRRQRRRRRARQPRTPPPRRHLARLELPRRPGGRPHPPRHRGTLPNVQLEGGASTQRPTG